MNNKYNFPRELTALQQWLCWRLEKNKSGRDTKVPYSPSSGMKAQISNPATWGTLDEALHTKDKYLFSGIGFVFTDECDIIGIDIDHCLDGDIMNATAMEILSKLPPTYIETSPSGTGLHIFLRGKLPEGGNRNSKVGVEMYSSARYFTMTGNRWRDCADAIAEDNGAIAYIHKTFISPPKRASHRATANTAANLSDDELLRLAQASKDGEAFGKLYTGDWQNKYKSQSEADFALCCKLAFWSGRNEAQIDRLFRKSGLYREKWDSQHSADGATYGVTTVKNACANTSKTYTPPKTPEICDIFERYGGYWRDRNQKVYQLTNFVIEPIEMITAEKETMLTCDLVTAKGKRFRQTFNSKDFANLQRLKDELTTRTIALSFYGTAGDVEPFKDFVEGLNWTEKRGVKALGIYPHNGKLVFVDTNGAVRIGGEKVDDIVQLEKDKSLESDILTAPFLDKAGLQLMGKHVLCHNLYPRTVPLMLWGAGCFIKPHLKKVRVKYPHLFLIGEPGSGKSTSLENVVLPIVGKTTVMASSQVTTFTVMTESNSSNVIPQAFDEFKPSTLARDKLYTLYNHLRDAYDWHRGVRGKADQSKIYYDLLAPIAVAGEESAEEGAIRERTIELLFARRDLKNEEHKAAYDWLSANVDIMRSFGRSLMDVALQTTPKEVREWHDEGGVYFNKDLPARIKSNLCAMYAAMCLINKLCQSLGCAFREVFPLNHAACAANLEYAARQYLLDDSTYNKGAVETAFEVMSRMKLKQDEDYAFENGGQYLCIHIAGCYDRYTKYKHDYCVMGEVLSDRQFLKRLEHSEFFVEKNRNKTYKNGQQKRSWVVDFKKLSAVCEVSGFVKETDTDE